jgi:hypothetical protein
MAKSNGEREQIRVSVQRNIGPGRFTIEEMAEACAVPPWVIKNILREKSWSVSRDHGHKIEAWLKQRGYWLEKQDLEPQTARTADDDLLSQMVAVAEVELDGLLAAIKSRNYSDEAKIRKLYAWIEINHGELPRLRELIEQGRKKGHGISPR